MLTRLTVNRNTTPDILQLKHVTEDLFEVGHTEQLLDPGQEVRYERLEGRVETLVENLLKQT